MHSIQSTDPASGKLFQDKTDEEAYRIAFEETLTDIQRFDGFDVLGHLDYVVRYGKEREKQYSYRKYADVIDQILKALIEKGKGLN
ncbi:MAG: PHP domain-containing protein [[Clostridium] scindens]